MPTAGHCHKCYEVQIQQVHPLTGEQAPIYAVNSSSTQLTPRETLAKMSEHELAMKYYREMQAERDAIQVTPTAPQVDEDAEMKDAAVHHDALSFALAILAYGKVHQP